MLVERFCVTFTNIKELKMSRIGNNPIVVPENISIDITETVITVKGKLGELAQEYSSVKFIIKDNFLIEKH